MSEVEKPERSRFVLHSEKTLVPLGWWLKDRRYNNYYPYLQDSRGNRMIGVNWRTRDEYGRETLVPCGLVLVRDESIVDQAIKIIEEHLTRDQ
jgi:hypothetical protein